MNSMRSYTFLVLSAAIAVCSAPLAQASTTYLLHSFEDGDLTTPYLAELNNGQNVQAGVIQGTGNTDGDWAAFVEPTPTETDNGFRIALQVNLDLAAVQALKATRTIAWDVTVGPDPDPNDDVTGLGSSASYNTNLTGFQTSTTFPSTFDAFFLDFVPYGGSVTTSITYDQVVVDAFEAAITGSISGTPGFAQFIVNNLMLNSDLSQPSPIIYIDNIRILVPEPLNGVMLSMLAAFGGIGLRRGSGR